MCVLVSEWKESTKNRSSGAYEAWLSVKEKTFFMKIYEKVQGYHIKVLFSLYIEEHAANRIKRRKIPFFIIIIISESLEKKKIKTQQKDRVKKASRRRLADSAAAGE